MTMFEMRNEFLYVQVNEHASEIMSVRNLKDNTEYMWQGDPQYWAGRNPTLFPMVGSTYDKKLHIKGKIYETGNHGFARSSDFTCVEHTENTIIMELRDSEDTLKQYPYHFTLRNIYRLEGSTLSVQTEVVNGNEEDMPFNLGYHPAFNVPFTSDRTWEDAEIRFNEPETFEWKGFAADSLQVMKLDKERLVNTIIIKDPKSSEYTLSDGCHSVKMTAKNFPWIAFWSKNAPFVCLEPWHSHTDFEPVDVPFEEREGTLITKPGEVFATGYTLSFD